MVKTGEEHNWKRPVRIGNIGNSECWFKGNGQYDMSNCAKGYLSLSLITSIPNKNSLNHALFDILSSIVTAVVNKEFYDAKMANIDYSISTRSSFNHLPVVHFYVKVPSYIIYNSKSPYIKVKRLLRVY